MRFPIVLSLLIGAAMMPGAANALGHEQHPEAQLARIIARRMAAGPVDCLNLNQIRSSRVINGTAIVYEDMGGAIYVNRPRTGANLLRGDRALAIDAHADRLCNADTLQLVDLATHMPNGSVSLGPFIPYVRYTPQP